MDAVLLLNQGFELAAVKAALSAAGARASPMHPGIQDETLARYFELSLDAADGPAADAVLARLREHPAVDAAYLKPAGEAPG